MGLFAPADAGRELEEHLRRYQQGEGQAAALLVRALSPVFLRYCTRMGDPRDAAEDIVQEIWLRIHQARHTYRPGQPALPWLFAVARHARLDALRRRLRVTRRETSVAELPDVAAAAPVAAHDDLAGLIADLPESQREVLVMLKALDMSLEEVARATSTTVGAVKQKAHRAYGRLRELLGSRAAPVEPPGASR
jgi:RNA polymerase sigma-70 factor, ECF subfamily